MARRNIRKDASPMESRDESGKKYGLSNVKEGCHESAEVRYDY